MGHSLDFYDDILTFDSASSHTRMKESNKQNEKKKRQTFSLEKKALAGISYTHDDLRQKISQQRSHAKPSLSNDIRLKSSKVRPLQDG